MEKVWVVEFEELTLSGLNAVFSTKEKAKNYVKECINKLQSKFRYIKNAEIISSEDDEWITWEYTYKNDIYSIIISEYEVK